MIKLYNTSLALVAILNNAFDISFEQKLNELHTASFSMPADDPKVVDCQPLYFVEIYDKSERIDMFRIMPTKQYKDDAKNVITFECEHVIATLLDDVMFQLNESGGALEDTSTVLAYILGKQTVERWTLDSCEFTRLFEYKWENENLLNALFSVPKPFNADYQWTWDTSVYPWELSLIEPSTDIDSRIMYKKNLIGIEKEVDTTQLITRLYGLGYGEGVNQLTIKSVNSGVAYIDASTKTTYGIISRIFADNPLSTNSGRPNLVVIDEAQNLTIAELNTLMTRMGEFAKVIVCGDPEISHDALPPVNQASLTR
jgi:phage minor structural protein